MDTHETESARQRTNTPYIALVFVALLAAPLSWFLWAMQREQSALATLRAAGEPTSFAELAPRPIPPEHDATVFLDRASPDLKAFTKEQADFFRTPEGEAFDRRQPPTPEQIATIRDILSRYPDLPRTLQQAAACEGYASQIDFTAGYPQMMAELLRPTNDVRAPARFLRWQITSLLAQGEQEEALEAGMVILRLARLYEAEPAMVNGLVAHAIRGIATEGINLALRAGPISAALRDRLDEELALQDDPQRVVRMMKSERAINISVTKGSFKQARWLPWVGIPQPVDIIDFYDGLLPLLSRPWHESQIQLHLAATDIANDLRSGVSAAVIESLLPALLASMEAENRSVALLRSLRIVNHLTAYAQENGHEASGLDDLGLPKSATLDPFSGKPLKLKWTDEGWVVYTVSTNGRDDGGDFKDMADWGLNVH